MLLDLLDPNNYANYNIKLAQIAGLEVAVYVNQLITIQNKALKKDKLYNGYFKLNREFITKQTSLTSSQQAKLDEDLINLHILLRDSSDSSLLKLDLDVLGSIIANDDIKLEVDLRKITKTNKKLKKEIETNSIIKNLKKSIKFDDAELVDALGGWIEAIYAGPKPYLSKASVEAFQQTLYNYTHDASVALEIVRIATSSFLTNCQWAINDYEKSVRMRQTNVQSKVMSKKIEGESSGVVF